MLISIFSGPSFFGKKTLFVEVSHRKRVYGVSKYGTFDRLYQGIRDIFKVKKIIKNQKYIL